MFTGASFLSIVEIFYYFGFRIWFIKKKHYLTTKNKQDLQDQLEETQRPRRIRVMGTLKVKFLQKKKIPQFKLKKIQFSSIKKYIKSQKIANYLKNKKIRIFK